MTEEELMEAVRDALRRILTIRREYVRMFDTGMGVDSSLYDAVGELRKLCVYAWSGANDRDTQ